MHFGTRMYYYCQQVAGTIFKVILLIVLVKYNDIKCCIFNVVRNLFVELNKEILDWLSPLGVFIGAFPKTYSVMLVKVASLFISIDLVTLFLLIVALNAYGYFALMRKTSVM